MSLDSLEELSISSPSLNLPRQRRSNLSKKKRSVSSSSPSSSSSTKVHTSTTLTTGNHTSEPVKKVWKPPSFSNQEFSNWINRLPDPHVPCKKAIKEYHESCFQEWELELLLGYSIALYGYGSKKPILTSLLEYLSIEKKYPCFYVSATHPEVSFKSFKTKLFDFLQSSSSSTFNSTLFPTLSSFTSTSTTSLEAWTQLITSLDTPVFLILDPWDAPVFRSSLTTLFWNTLLSLASMGSHLHLIGSLDHVQSTWLLSSSSSSCSHLIYHHVTTFEPYDQEIAFQSHLGLLSKTKVTPTSVWTVLKSLPRNHQKCFHRLLLFTSSSSASLPMTRSTSTTTAVSSSLIEWQSQLSWYHQCRESFLVADSFAFQSMLAEFLDHQLLVTKTIEGTTMVKVNLDEQGREKVLEFLQEGI